MRKMALALGVQMAFLGGTAWATPARVGSSARASADPAGWRQNPQDKKASSNAPLENTGVPAQGTARGKKLVLKDGSYQLVRSYEQKADRVRYFSIERDDWEEIPASLVDWDATKKAAAAEEKTDAAVLEKARIQTEESRVAPPLDVDASLTVGQGVFLPEGEGMFVLEGKTIKTLKQVESAIKTDKKTELKRVLTPIPIVPGKRNVEIAGSKAAVRITTAAPEFYLREKPLTVDGETAIERTGRANLAGPDVMLVKVRVKGNKRYVESIRSMFGQEVGEERKEISMQRWEVAPDVYRFTLSEPLTPGEYALAEVLEDGMNFFVWDFGVDGASGAKPVSH